MKYRSSSPTPKIMFPVYRPYIGVEEEEVVLDCVKSKWISSRGEYIEKFEIEFANFIGVKKATAVCNGTVALHLALKALDVGPGDEVIVPSLTYIATANAVRYVGAVPVFADSKLNTWNIDPKNVRKKVTKKTKAIIAVHLYGNPCDLDELSAICKANNLYLIEDAAEAFGSVYQNHFIGGYGDICTFSFFGNKTITTGEGGMVTSNNLNLIARTEFLKNQGLSKTKEYWHEEIGFNYRMTNICAAIGLAQLKKSKIILEKKQRIFNQYFHNLSNRYIFQNTTACCKNSYWMVTMLVNGNQQERDKLRIHLRDNGIETRPIFYPLHTMGAHKESLNLPIAESIAGRGINLPSYPDLTEDDIDQICRYL
tara:strand:- start:47 stop:1150 length:1104 start_codon:yes stop_codon:yes gene_type:complete